MIISVTSKDFDIDGAILLDVPSPNFGDTRRRSTRVATLDGGAAVNDFGFTDSDRTITLAWSPTRDEDTIVRRLVRYHDRVRASTPMGLMECIVGAYSSEANGTATLTLLPVSRLSG